MAQALEKIFLQKVAAMPQEEVELLPPPPKGKGRKPGAPPSSGDYMALMFVYQGMSVPGVFIGTDCICTYLETMYESV